MSITPVNINAAIREHQLEELRGETGEAWWKAELALIHTTYLADIVTRFFGGTLPLPAISCEWDRKNVLGSYEHQDGLLLPHRININRRYPQLRAELLHTLTHELCHEWQYLFGKPPRPPYHNKEFQKKMATLGIPCDGKGYRTGLDDPFLSFLTEHGLELSAGEGLGEKADPPKTKNPRLVKWECRCINFWAWRGIDVSVQCLKCEGIFARAADA